MMTITSHDHRDRQVQHQVARVCACWLAGHFEGQASRDALSFLAHHYQQDGSIKALVASFGSLKLQRRLTRLSLREEPSEPPSTKGTLVRQYKKPIPTEEQAAIAYEHAIDEYKRWLLTSHHLPILHETATSWLLFVPEGVEWSEGESWETFIQEELFSLESFIEKLLPLLNLDKLSARGFSIPDLLLISPGTRLFFAAWLYRVFLEVQQRLSNRQQKLQAADLTDKERQTLQDKQDKEQDKYQSNLQKSFEKRQVEQDKHDKKLQKVDDKIAKSKKPSGKTYQKLLAQKQELEDSFPIPKARWASISGLCQKHDYDPFALVEDVFSEGELAAQIKSLATRFNKTAADQINHPRGDIFAGLVFTLLELLQLEDRECQFSLPPLVCSQSPQGDVRPPGLGQDRCCYVCGATLRDTDPVFEVRRMIFFSPEQRLQASGRPSRPLCCLSCVAYSLICGVKQTDGTTIIKIHHPNEHLDTWQTKQIRQALINKELDVQAGPYILLRTRERVLASGKWKPASEVLGGLGYAYYTLANELPTALFSQMSFSYYNRGAEQPLSNAALLWLHALLQASQLSLVQQGSINQQVSKAIRLIIEGAYIEAEYTIASELHPSRFFLFQYILAPFRERLITLIEEEPNMIQSEAPTLRDLAALTGLLMPFIQRTKTLVEQQKDKNAKDAQREMAKLMEKSEHPADFAYAFASQAGQDYKSVRLYLQQDNQFLFTEAKRLLGAIYGEENADKRLQTETKEAEGAQSKKSPFLQLYSNDLLPCYEHILSSSKEYDKRTFLTKLRLNLYSQFPQVLSRYQKEQR